MKKYADAILAIINNSSEHLTAEEVYMKVKAETGGIVLASVYNNLNRLVRQGKIARLSVEGSPDRYDRIDKHDHLVCVECGRITDICFEDLTEDLQKQTDGKIISYDLKVRYLCPACRQKAKA